METQNSCPETLGTSGHGQVHPLGRACVGQSRSEGLSPWQPQTPLVRAWSLQEEEAVRTLGFHWLTAVPGRHSPDQHRLALGLPTASGLLTRCVDSPALPRGLWSWGAAPPALLLGCLKEGPVRNPPAGAAGRRGGVSGDRRFLVSPCSPGRV